MKSLPNAQHFPASSRAHLRRAQTLQRPFSRHLPGHEQDTRFNKGTMTARKLLLSPAHRVTRGKACGTARVSLSHLSVPCYQQAAKPAPQVETGKELRLTGADKRRSGRQEVMLGDTPDLCPGHKVSCSCCFSLTSPDTRSEQQSLQ